MTWHLNSSSCSEGQAWPSPFAFCSAADLRVRLIPLGQPGSDGKGSRQRALERSMRLPLHILLVNRLLY